MKRVLAAAAVVAAATAGAATAQQITPLAPTKSTQQQFVMLGGVQVPLAAVVVTGVLAVGGIVIATTSTSGT